MIIGSIRWIWGGKKYQWNWLKMSLHSSNASQIRWPSSHVINVNPNAYMISVMIKTFPAELLSWCVLHWFLCKLLVTRKTKTVYNLKMHTISIWIMSRAPHIVIRLQRNNITKIGWINSENLSSKLDIRIINLRNFDACYQFYGHSLNCLTIEWNSMNFEISSKIDARLFFIWAPLLIECKRCLIILLVAIKNKYVPIEIAKAHTAIIMTFLAIMYWMLIATKYPKGFLQSNGNLNVLTFF